MAAIPGGYLKDSQPVYDVFDRDMFPEKYEEETFNYDPETMEDYSLLTLSDYSTEPATREYEKPRRTSYFQRSMDARIGVRDYNGMESGELTPYHEEGTVDTSFMDWDPRQTSNLPLMFKATDHTWGRADFYRADLSSDSNFHVPSGGERFEGRAIADRTESIRRMKKRLHFNPTVPSKIPSGGRKDHWIANDASKNKLAYTDIYENAAINRGAKMYHKSGGEFVKKAKKDTRLNRMLYDKNRMKKVELNNPEKVSKSKTDTRYKKSKLNKNKVISHMMTKQVKGQPIDFDSKPREIDPVRSDDTDKNRNFKINCDIGKILGFTENQIRFATSKKARNLISAPLSQDQKKIFEYVQKMNRISYTEKVAMYNRLILQKMNVKTAQHNTKKDTRVTAQMTGKVLSKNPKQVELKIEKNKKSNRINTSSTNEKTDLNRSQKQETDIYFNSNRYKKSARSAKDSRKGVNYTKKMLADAQANQQKTKIEKELLHNSLKSTNKGYQQNKKIITTNDVRHETKFGPSYSTHRSSKPYTGLRLALETNSVDLGKEMTNS